MDFQQDGTWKMTENPTAWCLGVVLEAFQRQQAQEPALCSCMDLQSQVVLMLCEKLAKTTNPASFVSMWDSLRSSTFFSGVGSLVNFSDPRKLPIDSKCNSSDCLINGWSFQSAVDLSVLMVGSSLLGYKGTNEPPPISLRALARQMINNKAKVSIRLRAACGPRNSGCHNSAIGTMLWEQAVAIQAQGMGNDQARSLFVELAAKFAPPVFPELVRGDAAGAADQIVEWQEQVSTHDLVSKLFEVARDFDMPQDSETQAATNNLGAFLTKLLSVIAGLTQCDRNWCDSLLEDRLYSSCGVEPNTKLDEGLAEEADNTLAWFAMAFDLAKDIAKLIGHQLLPVLSEAWTRLSLVERLWETCRDFNNLFDTKTLTLDEAGAALKKVSDMWQQWCSISAAPAQILKADGPVKVIIRVLCDGLRNIKFQDLLMRVLSAMLSDASVAENILPTTKGLMEVLPPAAKQTYELYSKWLRISTLVQKLKQCKLVGNAEFATVAGFAKALQGSVVGGVSTEQFQAACSEIEEGYHKAFQLFLKRNGSMNMDATKAWVHTFFPVLDAAATWGFCALEWFGKHDEAIEGRCAPWRASH